MNSVNGQQSHGQYTRLVEQGASLPLKRGANSQQLRGPALENCPRASSMQNRGMPTKMRTIVQGTRKAPPPLRQHKQGKRQTLPSPTAYLQHASNSFLQHASNAFLQHASNDFLATCKQCLPATCKQCLPAICKQCLLATCKVANNGFLQHASNDFLQHASNDFLQGRCPFDTISKNKINVNSETYLSTQRYFIKGHKMSTKQ